MSMQQFIIGWSRKNFFVVEEVHLLFVRQCDVRMFAQKIMQRGRARFLCAGNNEIESFELLWLGSEHRGDDQSRAASCWAQSHSSDARKSPAHLINLFCNAETRFAVFNDNEFRGYKVRPRHLCAG